MGKTKHDLWPLTNVPAATKAKVRACKALLKKKTLAETLDTMADITFANLPK